MTMSFDYSSQTCTKAYFFVFIAASLPLPVDCAMHDPMYFIHRRCQGTILLAGALDFPKKTCFMEPQIYMYLFIHRVVDCVLPLLVFFTIPFLLDHLYYF